MRPATGARIPVLVALASLGLFAAVAGGGCGTIEEAQQVVSRADLVNDLANRLSNANETTFLAEYQVPSGQIATMAQAQRPRRSAFTYPGGKVVINSTATAECATKGTGTDTGADTDPVCTLTAPPLSTSGPPAGVLDAAQAQGLVHPTVVIGLLTGAALDTNAVIEQSDTTIAGEHATCVDVEATGAEKAFKACITADGVLGSFSGTLQDRPVDVTLVKLSDSVPDTAFDLPVNATITDNRTR